MVLNFTEHITCTMAGRMKQTSGWEHSGRKILNANLLVFIINGSAVFQFNGQSFSAGRGDILIIPARTYYTPQTRDFCEYFFFHFSGNITEDDSTCLTKWDSNPDFSFFLKELENFLIFLKPFTETGNQFEQFFGRIVSCLDYNATGLYTDRILLDIEFEKLLVLLSRLTEEQNSRPVFPVILDKIIVYIKKNLTKPLSFSELCKEFKISPSYLARLFKKNLNTTAAAYINNEKLRYAAELLKNTNMNISETADYLGYCDIFYFSKLFKKKFGKCPSKYK